MFHIKSLISLISLFLKYELSYQTKLPPVEEHKPPTELHISAQSLFFMHNLTTQTFVELILQVYAQLNNCYLHRNYCKCSFFLAGWTIIQEATTENINRSPRWTKYLPFSNLMDDGHCLMSQWLKLQSVWFFLRAPIDFLIRGSLM